MSRNDDPHAPRGEPNGEFHAIHLAARARDLAQVRALLDAGTPVDLKNAVLANGDGGNTALWFAAQGPWPNGLCVAKLLVERGANVNEVCEYGMTPLHIAAAWGHAEVAAFLCESGARLKACDADGCTPKELARKGYDWRREHEPEHARPEIIEFFESLDLASSN